MEEYVKIVERARDVILSREFEQVSVNLPTVDMVRNTGDIESTIDVCKAVDGAIRMILDAIEQVGGIYVVTADHGNTEDMLNIDKTGQPILSKSGNIQILGSGSHTLQPAVPFAIGGPGLAPSVHFHGDIPNPGLSNLAATLINLHGFEAPANFQPSLIQVGDN